jgi:hypothetical protein
MEVVIKLMVMIPPTVKKNENTTHYIKEEDHHNFVGSLTPTNIWEVYNHKQLVVNNQI